MASLVTSDEVLLENKVKNVSANQGHVGSCITLKNNNTSRGPLEEQFWQVCRLHMH
jgi:hypothetical protein